MMDTINTPEQTTKLEKTSHRRINYQVQVNLPQAHDIMAIGIDSDGEVTNFSLFCKFLFTVFSAHIMPKPLALGISKFLTIILTHLQFTLDKL